MRIFADYSLNQIKGYSAKEITYAIIRLYEPLNFLGDEK